MRFVQIATEDESQQGKDPVEPANLNPNEAEKAAEAIENQDSTEPEKVLQVANYKEELGKLLSQKGNDDTAEDPGTGDAGGESGDPDSSGETSEEPAADGSDDTPADDGSAEEDPPEDLSEEDTEPVDAEAELGEEGAGKSDEQVAQEQFIAQGHKMASEGLESITVMRRYHSMLTDASKLGGISQHTAKVITQAFEHHCSLVGYQPKERTPALEDFCGYTSAYQATRQLTVAIEGFIDTVWQSIKKFMKAVWQWIVDLLNGGKGNTTNPVAHPQSKQDRSKAVKNLEAQIKLLEEQLDQTNKLRAKDQERFKGQEDAAKKAQASERELSRRLAMMIFRSTDKGTALELQTNARELNNAMVAADAVIFRINLIVPLLAMHTLNGKIPRPDELVLGKQLASSLKTTVVKSGSNPVTESISDEIVGGSAMRFMFGASDLKGYDDRKTRVRLITDLGRQGFRVVTAQSKGNFPSAVPPLEKPLLVSLNVILKEIEDLYNRLNSLQATITDFAGVAKEVSEGREIPTSWKNLDNESLAIVQAQINFIGLIETNAVAGYKSVSDLVNNYKNGIERLTKLYITGA